MKKLFLIPALLLSAWSARAQISFMPEIGGNLSSLTQKVSMFGGDYTLNGKWRPGFRAGVAMNGMITYHIGIQPGIYYSYNSSKMELEILGTTNSVTYSTHAIQVPVYLMYYSNTEINDGFFAGVGPFANYYFSGTKKGDINSGGSVSASSSESISFGNDASKDDSKPFDYGASVTAGYVLPMGLAFRAYFNLGLANLQPEGDKDNRMKSMSVGVSVGYNF